MASAQVVEMSVANNSPSQDSNHPDDLFQSRYVTPGFKPFSYLDRIVRSINEEIPNSGYQMVYGVLRVSTLSWWNWRLWMRSEMVSPTTQLNFLLNLSTLASPDP